MKKLEAGHSEGRVFKPQTFWIPFYFTGWLDSPLVVRFLHTADWQLGKPYGRVKDPEKRARLKQLRFAIVEQIAQLVETKALSFVLVAGDLFDSIEPTRADVAQACSAIGVIDAPVFVIPGNHDHGGIGSFWHEAWFKSYQKELAPNLQLLLERQPVQLSDVLLLPCPLLRQADLEDPTAWLRHFQFDPAEQRACVLLAHGSVHGFGGDSASDADDENPCGPTNRIDLEALPQDFIDYTALGDWHGLKKISTKAWYSGCPEPDRFPRGENYRSSQVLVVEVERSQPASVSVETTGIGVWHQLKQRLNGDGDLAVLEKQLQILLGNRSGMDLLLLELDGYLSLEAGVQLQNKLEQLEARLLRLKLRDRIKLTPNEAELQQLIGRSGDPLVARVAQRLLSLTESEDTQKAELALLALRELHGACGQLS